MTSLKKSPSGQSTPTLLLLAWETRRRTQKLMTRVSTWRLRPTLSPSWCDACPACPRDTSAEDGPGCSPSLPIGTPSSTGWKVSRACIVLQDSVSWLQARAHGGHRHVRAHSRRAGAHSRHLAAGHGPLPGGPGAPIPLPIRRSRVRLHLRPVLSRVKRTRLLPSRYIPRISP